MRKGDPRLTHFSDFGFDSQHELCSSCNQRKASQTVKMTVHYTSEDSRGAHMDDGWNESAYPQGTNGDYYRIWKLEHPDNTTYYFKQRGTADSYAYTVEWSDEPMVEVQANPVQITQYEYVEK